ncbi:cation diffusion facilitator family transporter [Paracoccus contaminans]|uniref:Cation transporter n=1 Tax=Paracoccus contaminans TaxID=1945662 RepID=A0A1W6CYG1_9RHOB|nr:cation diffusion facilitator family transporter [Paracoccus contaminans]ARJ69888.1 cation transporter [Paracoccus contaminans]
MPHDHGPAAHAHGRGHAHGHDQGAGLGDRSLLWAVLVNLALTAAQIVGGLAAGSVALVADGVHNLSDALALVLAYVARRMARRPADERMTFGWGRAEIIAAFLNYLALIGISLWLAVEAVLRLIDPPPVAGRTVVALAALAIVVNGVTTLLTWRMAQGSANVRAAFLHAATDALVSVAVVIGGLLILWLGWRWIDPALTLLISAVIVWHVIRDIGPVWRTMMLGAPPGFDIPGLRAALAGASGVAGIHHLHLWQIDERRISAEMHVVLADGASPRAVRLAVRAVLARHGITHSTIETETMAEGCADPRGSHDGEDHGHDEHDHDHDHAGHSRHAG